MIILLQLNEIKERIRSSQIKATISVNTELINVVFNYWKDNSG